MRKYLPCLLLALIGAAGCRKGPAAHQPAPTAEPAVVKTTTVSGFDPDGEPEIRAMSDGSLYVIFNFMPPSFVPERDPKAAAAYDDFEKELEQAVGLPVLREDREVFLIRNPKKDTVERLTHFLEGYRKKKKP
jgi:hypothetical protein